MTHPDSIEHRVQRAEELVSWTGRERFRFLWYWLRLAISEMNYASRRLFELQTQLPTEWPSVPPPASKKALPVSLLRLGQWRIGSPHPAVLQPVMRHRKRTEMSEET